MHSFFALVGFEYKKIFQSKSAIIALVLVTALIVLSPFVRFFETRYIGGGQTESFYEGMVKDREYARVLTGRAVDEALLAETREAYLKIPEAGVYEFEMTPEYQRYVRQYSDIINLMFAAYTGHKADMESLRNLSDEDLHGFYKLRHESVAAGISTSTISDKAKDRLIEFDSEIPTPFIYAYTGGIQVLLESIVYLGIAAAFALAISLAPMFAGEYSTGADQLILSSKHGKGKLLSAKLFTAVSLLVVFFLLLYSLTFAVHIPLYGIDGWNAPLQLFIAGFVYPLTMGETVFALTVCVFCGILLTVSLTLLLSARFKSPFGVIIIISAALFVPVMIYVPETMAHLYRLHLLLPTKMMMTENILSHVPFDFFGLIVPPYIFLPIFAVIVSAILLPLAMRSFRNYQNG